MLKPLEHNIFILQIYFIILFNTINAVINSAVTTGLHVSPAICENLLRFFINKTSHISPSACDPTVPPTCSAVLNQFEPVSLSLLREIISNLKPFYSISPY